MASVTHMTVAPITLFAGMGANEVTIEVLGTWTMRVEASGKPGGAKVTFNPEANGADPVIRVLMGGVLKGQLTLNDILGKAGVSIPSAQTGGLLNITAGTQPHAIGDDTKPAPAAPEGTSASGAADIVKVRVLNAAPQIQGADIRVGHMEGKANAAVGGIDCPLPVKKDVSPAAVTAGGDVTYTITIPSSIADFADIACDLKDISADDVASLDPLGPATGPTMTLTSADHGGVIDPKHPQVGPAKATTGHITWANIGSYKKGDKPIEVLVKAHVPATSAAGKIINSVTVHATLANCSGGALGQDFVGNALVNGKAATINGSAFVGASNAAGLDVSAVSAVKSGVLSTTGPTQPWLPVVGGGLLLGALALMRSRRRLKAEES